MTKQDPRPAEVTFGYVGRTHTFYLKVPEAEALEAYLSFGEKRKEEEEREHLKETK